MKVEAGVCVCVYVCFSKLALHRSLPEGGGFPACGAGPCLFLSLSRKPEERRRNVAPPPPLLRPPREILSQAATRRATSSIDKKNLETLSDG